MSWTETLEARWQGWWSTLEAREKRLVQIAAALIGLAFLWWVALAPALRTLSSARAEHLKLDAQLQQMSDLQARAKALQAQPRASRDDALRSLEGSVREGLGANAQLQPAGGGEGMTVAVRGTPADGLARWLAQARSNARAVPRELHLTRNNAANPAPGAEAAPGATAAASASTPGARWDGTLVMNLPAR